MADSLDEFSQQFNVMLQRTGAVTSEDVVSAVPKAAYDSNILVSVTLSSLEAAVKVTTAVEERKLAVYIDGKGCVYSLCEHTIVTNNIVIRAATVLAQERSLISPTFFHAPKRGCPSALSLKMQTAPCIRWRTMRHMKASLCLAARTSMLPS